MDESQLPLTSVTESHSEVPAPLHVETDLTVSVEGTRVTVESTGERLLVQFRSVSDLLVALRNRPTNVDSSAAGLLTTADLTAEVRVRDRIVAVAGADARSGVLGRLLDVDPVEVRSLGVLGSLGAELRAGIDSVAGVFR
jgi:hypothetical protein